MAGDVSDSAAALPSDKDDGRAKTRSARDGRMLYVDVTGALLGFGGPPTGIPRIEDFLARAALADPDPAVMPVKLNSRRRVYESLDALERKQLWNGIDAEIAAIRGAGLGKTLRRTFRIIRHNPALGRDADRHFADIATSNRRRGLSYQVVKTIVRAYRLYRRSIAQITLALSERKKGPVDLAHGTILLSNRAVLSSSSSRAFDGSADRAFICYDLIPILRPAFAIDTDFAKGFASSIHGIMRLHDTWALCISEASEAMLVDYARNAGLDTARIGRFPVPSILLEKAGELPSVSTNPVGEPFILYCSTVEARKNHLLLARVWQRALDEGAALPRLVCVGKWGWGVDELKAYLAAHPRLLSHIVFTGPVSDAELVGYYRHAMFGVVPSYLEGWGYGASECLDFGVPVIVSTAPALREATRGLMPAISPDDLQAWYAAIRRLADSDEQRAWYRQRIADQYRPTTASASWAHIKAALLHD